MSEAAPSRLRWIAAALVAVAVAVHGLRPIIDLDLWWHMRLGEVLWTGEADASVDIFSFTRAGTPWPWKDAGAAVLFFGLWQLGGAWAVILFKAVAFAATALLTWRLLAVHRRAPLSLAMVVLAATLDAVAFRFTERAASLSLLVLVAVLVLIERDRAGKRGLWWIVALTIVNANLHRAALLLPVIVGAYAAARLLEHMLRPTEESGPAWRRAALVTVATALGCLATPYGIRIVTTTIALMGQHSPLITEWAPVSAELIAILTPASFVTIGLGVLGTALGQWKLRPWAIWDLMLAAIALGLGLSSMRHLPVLALLIAGPAATGLAAATSAFTGRLRGLITVSAAAALLASTLAHPIALPGPTLAPAHFPERGVQFIEQLPQAERPRGAVFNEFGYGGFLIFHQWPQQRVYIDGRTDLVYPAEHVLTYAEALHSPEVLAAEVQRWDLQWAFLDNVPMDRGRLHFDLDPAWTLVHASRRALIYVRTEGQNSALAEREGYRYLAAHDLLGSVRAAAARGHGADAVAELRRMAQDDPDNLYAVAALAQIAQLASSP